jgi:hypothetical protein
MLLVNRACIAATNVRSIKGKREVDAFSTTFGILGGHDEAE